MNQEMIFYPILGQIFLTLIVYVKLLLVKKEALKCGAVNLGRRALHEDAWPNKVLGVSRNLQNQFESPVLFYVICFIYWALRVIDVFVIVMSWLFVFFRLIHMIIHTGENDVLYRKAIFLCSSAILLILSLVVLVRI